MKITPPRITCCAIALVAFHFNPAAQAAFIIEPNGKAAANYSSGTATAPSTTAGSGTLLAPGLTFGAASVYGGEPYTFTYIPVVDGSNTTFSSATVLNSPAGLFASGLVGGAVGTYRIYHVFPQTANATNQPTLYDIMVNGGSTGVTMLKSSQDQNVQDAPNGVGTGLWELIGEATITDASDTITFTANTVVSSGVGVRTAGVLIDYIGVVPEPSSAVLLGLGVMALAGRRRR